jgi:hypothetical protein
MVSSDHRPMVNDLAFAQRGRTTQDATTSIKILLARGALRFVVVVVFERREGKKIKTELVEKQGKLY